MISWKKLLVAMALGTITACGSQQPAPQPPDTRFTFLNGEKPSLADFRGKVVLVNFWSVSCRPCLEELPELDRFRKELQSPRFEIIAVAMPYDRPDMILKVKNGMSLDFPVSLDISGKTGRDFGGIDVVPSSFLISAEGRILEKIIGVVDIESLKQKLKTLLKRG